MVKTRIDIFTNSYRTVTLDVEHSELAHDSPDAS